MEQTFKEIEIPYQTLSRFGLTRDMIEDLPERERERLLSGRKTSLLPLRVTTPEGLNLHSAARLSLTRTPSGEASLLFYPRLNRSQLKSYTLANGVTLSAGDTIVADGHYHRMDPQTHQVVRVPVDIIQNNIRNISTRMKLKPAEEILLMKGHLLTIPYKGRQLTLGVSFKDKIGILIVPGDKDDWERREKKDYLRYNFGLNGCWVADEEGGLDYIPEDQYTDDLWEEMRKQGSRHRAGLRSF